MGRKEEFATGIQEEEEMRKTKETVCFEGINLPLLLSHVKKML